MATVLKSLMMDTNLSPLSVFGLFFWKSSSYTENKICVELQCLYAQPYIDLLKTLGCDSLRNIYMHEGQGDLETTQL